MKRNMAIGSKFAGDQPVENPLLVADGKALERHLHVGLVVGRGEKDIPVSNDCF